MLLASAKKAVLVYDFSRKEHSNMYKIAFANRNLGYGSAIAILIMLLSLIFIISINKTVRIDGTEDS